MNSEPPKDSSQAHAQFALTHWSVVLSAGRSDSTHARDALEQLCRSYWPPIYAFIRRQGHGPQDAQDLTQEFFARLLEKHYLANIDPAKGRFRSFLLAAVKHFLANQWDRARAQKRGGNALIVPMDVGSAETGYHREPADQVTPERLFQRRWALTLLEEVLKDLREEYHREGKTDLFEALKTTLTGQRTSVPYSDLGAQLEMTESAVKVAVFRLRRRYREILCRHIAHTVSSPAEIEDEIRALFAALES